MFGTQFMHILLFGAFMGYENFQITNIIKN